MSRDCARPAKPRGLCMPPPQRFAVRSRQVISTALPRIAKEFPNAKFLVLWRDPADVCRSVVRARSDSFFAKRGMVLRALLGCRDLKNGYDTLAANGAQVYPVQYEDLVANPAAVMQGVCSFLEIEFDRRMVSLKDADRSAIYDADHHEMVNSEKIVAGKKKPRFCRKTFATRWRPTLPTGSRNPEALGHAIPSRRARRRDSCSFSSAWSISIVYRGLRTFDQGVALIYSYLPIGILRKYRASKGRATADALAPKRAAEKELVAAASQKQ